VIYENPGSFTHQLEQIAGDHDLTLAQLCEPIARQHGWLMREPRQRPACISLLQQERCSVLILKLERKLVDEMGLLEQIDAMTPDVPVIVVNEVKLDSDQRNALTALAYDLGARCVLFPPYPRSMLESVVERMMETTIARTVPFAESSDGTE